MNEQTSKGHGNEESVFLDRQPTNVSPAKISFVKSPNFESGEKLIPSQKNCPNNASRSKNRPPIPQESQPSFVALCQWVSNDQCIDDQVMVLVGERNSLGGIF